MRIRCVTSLFRSIVCSTRCTPCLSVQVPLQPPVSQTPCAPGRHFSLEPVYEGIAAGNKRQVTFAYLRGLVDARQGLWPKTEQVVDVDIHALSGRFPAVADIVVGDDGGKVRQGTDIKRQHDCDQVNTDQPGIAALKGNAGNNQDE